MRISFRYGADMSNRKGSIHPARVKALYLGLKKFTTGVACANGHMAERSTATGQCLPCRSEQKERYLTRDVKTAKAEIEREAMLRAKPEGIIPGARVFFMGKQVEV